MEKEVSVLKITGVEWGRVLAYNAAKKNFRANILQKTGVSFVISCIKNNFGGRGVSSRLS